MTKRIPTLPLALLLINMGCFQEGLETSTRPVDQQLPPAAAPRQNSAQLPPPTSPKQNIAQLPRPNHSAVGSTADDNTRPTKLSDSARLAEWYSVRENYEIVMNDVREFYKPVRPNGCVAFLSAALRRIGVHIPLSTGLQESPSLVTRPFSQYLESKLGWFRIGSASNLRAGDVVFTQDNPSYPDYPAHTYMFLAWSIKQNLRLALVIDNQDFTHERNIYDNDSAFNFTPYAYALRAP